MYRLIEFIRSTYIVVLFVIAEMIAIGCYAWSSSYTRAKFFVVSSSVTGGVGGALRSASHFVDLPEENRLLAERVAELEQECAMLKEGLPESLDEEVTAYIDPAHSYMVAKVVSNSINKRDNYIVINKGIEDGVYQNMAVITPSGEMVGYIAACSGHYSVALSVLSRSFTTSGKIEGGENYGSISWEGTNRYMVSMHNLSKYEIFEQGDKVVSTGFSRIFPGGVTIGTVESFELNEMETAYDLELNLAAELSAINYVLLVGSRDSGEVEELLEGVGSSYDK